MAALSNKCNASVFVRKEESQGMITIIIISNYFQQTLHLKYPYSISPKAPLYAHLHVFFYKIRNKMMLLHKYYKSAPVARASIVTNKFLLTNK